MAEDNFTEVSTQSWLSRLGGAFMGLFIGLLMFIAAFPLLFWNEGRAVERMLTLEEGSGAVISVDVGGVKPENTGKLVHASGMASTNDILVDTVFEVNESALKLRRNVSMYQWKEETSSKTEKQLGGSEKTITEYHYTKVWDSNLVSSSSFKKSGHDNPGSMPFSAQEFKARTVTLGAFTLPDSLVSGINTYSKLNIDPNKALPPSIGKSASSYDGGYYIGANPASPVVGDLRISFEIVKPTTVSIVSQQQQSTFQPYMTRVGGTVHLIKTGNLNAEAMFKAAHAENNVMTWVIRFVGFIIMGIGLSLIFKPLSVIADVLPIFGNIVEAGTGVIAFIIAAIFSLIVITTAWIFYRPLIGISLLVGTAVLIWMGKNRLSKSKTKA